MLCKSQVHQELGNWGRPGASKQKIERLNIPINKRRVKQVLCYCPICSISKSNSAFQGRILPCKLVLPLARHSAACHLRSVSSMASFERTEESAVSPIVTYRSLHRVVSSARPLRNASCAWCLCRFAVTELLLREYAHTYTHKHTHGQTCTHTHTPTNVHTTHRCTETHL